MYKAFIPLYILFLSACGSQNQTAVFSYDESLTELTNSIITFNQISLTLVSVKIQEQFYSVEEEINISLNINMEDGSYNGKSGCNSYFGNVELINQEKLLFNPGGMTEMMCEKPIMVWESRFFNLIIENEFYVNETENMVIFTDKRNETSMTFTKSEISEN